MLRCSVVQQNDNNLILVLCHCHLAGSPSPWKSLQKVGKSVVCYSCVSVFVGPINREMRHLISSLQNHNHQLKGEVLRYKRKLREAQSDLSKVSEQEMPEKSRKCLGEVGMVSSLPAISAFVLRCAGWHVIFDWVLHSVASTCQMNGLPL